MLDLDVGRRLAGYFRECLGSSTPRDGQFGDDYPEFVPRRDEIAEALEFIEAAISMCEGISQ